jgi:hypothetical protein
MTFSLTVRMIVSRLCAAALTVGLAFQANAQGGDAHAEPHGPRGHGGRGGGGLFISPCGRPYRAGPGEAYPVAAWFARADTNHDGCLDRGEFRADAAAFFGILDSNHDGVIDTDEVKVYEHDIVPEILRGAPLHEAMGEAKLFLAQFGGGGGGMGGGGGRGGGSHKTQPQTPTTPQEPLSEMVGAAPYGLLAEPEPVTAADTEFNGRITLAEFLAPADRRFDALDVDGQGRIALKDLPLTAVQQPPRA